MKNYFIWAAMTASCVIGVVGCDKSEPAVTQATTTKPDNTGINKTDRDTAAKTPMDQAENTADIKITADIRRALMDDKGMSTDAQNAKIITANGMVTLRGVVDSSTEKDSMETKAKSIAGVTGVDNQLTIKNP